MLYYLCKYTPIEAFQAMGIETRLLEPEVSSFPQADSFLHPNLCSYVKGVLEVFHERMETAPESVDGIVFTSCCDSVKRLYDLISTKYPQVFTYLLDLPRMTNDFAGTLYGQRIRSCVEAYAAWKGLSFSEDKLSDLLRSGSPQKEVQPDPEKIPLILMGARSGPDLLETIASSGGTIVYDMTCTDIQRVYPQIPEKDLFSSYGFQLLNQLPCMRMADTAHRSRLFEAYETRAFGIIYHTMKFCDQYSFEYAELKSKTKLPLLALETDGTTGSAGQIRTRIEAFLEEIQSNRKTLQVMKKKDQPMYILGIDSGSTSTNAVIINEKQQIIASEVLRTGARSMDSADRCRDLVLQKAALTAQELTMTVSTGYGRVSIPFADRNITEITCHAMGARFLDPSVRTILDIGGQDSKAIRLNEEGTVADFVMNDKCAAGTGRFLEAMARTLELPIEELGPLSLKSEEQVEISSMCTVFAESEVISLIALNKEPADIAAGVHRAIANKAMTLLRKVGLHEAFMMTGGVAKNPGVVAALEKLLHTTLILPKEPEIVGALGAALLGLQEIDK